MLTWAEANHAPVDGGLRARAWHWRKSPSVTPMGRTGSSNEVVVVESSMEETMPVPGLESTQLTTVSLGQARVSASEHFVGENVEIVALTLKSSCAPTDTLIGGRGGASTPNAFDAGECGPLPSTFEGCRRSECATPGVSGVGNRIVAERSGTAAMVVLSRPEMLTAIEAMRANGRSVASMSYVTYNALALSVETDTLTKSGGTLVELHAGPDQPCSHTHVGPALRSRHEPWSGSHSGAASAQVPRVMLHVGPPKPRSHRQA